MKHLPARLSTLLRLAVADAKKIQTVKKYQKVYKCDASTMGAWYEPAILGGERCNVCLAGAVMALDLKMSLTRSSWPTIFGDNNQRKLIAINEMRIGDFMEAWRHLCPLTELSDKKRATLTRATKAFGRCRTSLAPWRVYLKCARILKKGGL